MAAQDYLNDVLLSIEAAQSDGVRSSGASISRLRRAGVRLSDLATFISPELVVVSRCGQSELNGVYVSVGTSLRVPEYRCV